MAKRRELSRDFERLMAATAMFATQELERTALGDDQDYQDAKQETHEVVADVLDIVERSLDEDLLERLDHRDYRRLPYGWGNWPRYHCWSGLWPYGYGYKTYGGRPRAVRTTRTEDSVMLDQIIDYFRSDIEAKLKIARREERAISDAELDESLKDLKEDLKLISRRSRRREDRREEREESRASEKQTHARKG